MSIVWRTITQIVNTFFFFYFTDYTPLHNFQTQISLIQRDSIWFFHTKVKFMYNCSDKEFIFGYVIFVNLKLQEGKSMTIQLSKNCTLYAIFIDQFNRSYHTHDSKMKLRRIF